MLRYLMARGGSITERNNWGMSILHLLATGNPAQVRVPVCCLHYHMPHGAYEYFLLAAFSCLRVSASVLVECAVCLRTVFIQIGCVCIPRASPNIPSDALW